MSLQAENDLLRQSDESDFLRTAGCQNANAAPSLAAKLVAARAWMQSRGITKPLVAISQDYEAQQERDRLKATPWPARERSVFPLRFWRARA